MFALDLARDAAATAMAGFGKASAEIKTDGSPVTEVDRVIERHWRQRIQDRYPDHGIVGEELNDHKTAATDQWVLDPIDGTAFFTMGLPRFAHLIGLLADGEAQLGVVHWPVTNETLFAERGAGCWLRNGTEGLRRVAVPKRSVDVHDAAMSLAGLDGCELRPGDRQRFRVADLAAAVGSVDLVADCRQYLLLIQGHLHIAIDAIMKPWDSAAFIPCIREAGGVVTSLSGAQQLVYSGDLVATSHAVLHRQVLDLIAV